jgi:hypothetical protein
VPRGVHINFLKAERSLHRWALEDLQRIHTAEELAADEGGGVEMHVLEDAGHWVRMQRLIESFIRFVVIRMLTCRCEQPNDLIMVHVPFRFMQTTLMVSSGFFRQHSG